MQDTECVRKVVDNSVEVMSKVCQKLSVAKAKLVELK